MSAVNIHYGTCSWNYDSWKGLVYSTIQRNAAAYLAEYAEHFDTAEIDSWFYKIPDRSTVLDYQSAVPANFIFTVKVLQDITLTHKRNFQPRAPLKANPDFLSYNKMMAFLERTAALHPQIGAIMFEFEYLNKEKVPVKSKFFGELADFFHKLPQDFSYAVEIRNNNFLDKEYFEFIRDNDLIHVYTEKEFMPPVYQVFTEFSEYTQGTLIIRLMGGNRKEIESLTGEKWDRIVVPQEGKPQVAAMIRKASLKQPVFVNVNNHYEGSAPQTIETLQKLVAGKPA